MGLIISRRAHPWLRLLIPAFFLFRGVTTIVAALRAPDSGPERAPIPANALLTASPVPTRSSTPTPKLTAFREPGSVIVQDCLEIKEQKVPLKDIVKSGMSLWDNQYLLDFASGTQYQLPLTNNKEGDHILGMLFSPDWQALAYMEMLYDQSGAPVKEILRVVDTHGNLLSQTNFDRTDLILTRWLNRQMLQIYSNQTEQDGSLIVFNISTLEQTIVHNELPGLDRHLLPGTAWLVEYASDLSWVVYRAVKTDQDGIGPIVWDVTSQKILWQSPVSGYDVERPEWSPAGDQLALIAGGQLYIINRSGQARQVFGDSLNSYLSDLSWSPDARYIALRRTPKTGSEQRLMVYDTRTDQIVDYCIVSDQTYSLPPEWFPNSHQLRLSVWKKQADATVMGVELLLVHLGVNNKYSVKVG